ncbi:MAG TPA: sulfite exporter TauE/SafE family protein [Allosphingosinicella sp.]|jgi:uncharacterized membrane protein YfcA
MISTLEYGLLFVAAFAAGTINALAGGGSIFTFPVLIAAGIPPVAANITNTVALLPGYVGGVFAQRRDLAGQGRRLLLLLPVTAAGGLLGAWLLTRTSDRTFLALVPALILGACALLAIQDRARRFLSRGAVRIALGWAIIPMLLAAIYGGYFGAGVSVMFLALAGLAIDDSLTRLNGLKQAMALAANLAAALFFAGGGAVVWEAAGVMAVGALLGGAAGGRLASLVRPGVLRALVIAGGLVIALYFALIG